MDKLFHRIHDNGYNYVSVLGLKLAHVSKGATCYKNCQGCRSSLAITLCRRIKESLPCTIIDCETLHSLLKTEEKHFYQSQIVQNRNNLRKAWTIIKEVVNKKKCRRNSQQFILNDQVTVDPIAIANGFNNFFVNIGPTLASKITTVGISHRNFLKENLQSSFFLEPTNINEIKEVISKLKNGAPGRDEILPKHLKCISESIAHPLSK